MGEVHGWRGLKSRQAGGGDGLSVTLHLFVRGVEFDFRGQLRELVAENGAGLIEDDPPAVARADAPEEEQVVEIIKVCVVGQRIPEVHANRLVNSGGAFVALGHAALDGFELFGQRGAFIHAEPGGGNEPPDGLLRKILHAATMVAAPLIARGVLADIDRDEGKLVQPPGDLPLGIDVTGGLARAHGNAEDGVGLQGHGPGQRGNVAVIGHSKGHAAPLLLELAEQAADAAIKVFRGNAAKERTGAGLIIDIDTGGAAADGIDAGKLRGGQLQAVADAVEVIGRVGLKVGVPLDLLGEDDLAVDEGGAFAVAAPEVEADAAAFQVVLHRKAGGRGGIGRGAAFTDAHGLPEAGLTDKVAIESARALGPVGLPELGDNFVRPVHPDAAAAPCPQQGLDQPLSVTPVVLGMLRQVGEHTGSVGPRLAVRPGNRECDRARAGHLTSAGAVVAVPGRGRQEIRVEWWAVWHRLCLGVHSSGR